MVESTTEAKKVVAKTPSVVDVDSGGEPLKTQSSADTPYSFHLAISQSENTKASEAEQQAGNPDPNHLKPLQHKKSKEEKKKSDKRAKRNANQLTEMLKTPNNNFGLAQLFKRFVLVEESI